MFGMTNLDKSLNLIVCHAFTLSKLTRTDKENALCHFERSDTTGCKAQATAKNPLAKTARHCHFEPL